MVYGYAIPGDNIPGASCYKYSVDDWSKIECSQLTKGLPLTRVFAIPADANPNGDIFGGWLLSQMDLAGASLLRSAFADDARRWRSTRCVS